jgi:cytochrome c oxidase subunit II
VTTDGRADFLVTRAGTARRRTAARFGTLAGAALLLCGCDGAQSALSPLGHNAREVLGLWWLMFWTLAGAFVLVMAAFGLALFGPRRLADRLGGTPLIFAGGVALPVAAILLFLFAGLRVSWPSAPPAPGEPAIEVIGYQFWWEVRYPHPDGGAEQVISANEVRIPVGEPIRFRITTADVIHSFWIPKLAGKMDMIPGRANHLTIVAEEPGVFRGQCYEFCGAQHANMAFAVVAMPPDEFAAWLAREAQPAREPTDPFLVRGREVFVSAGCGSCHAIRGTAATGRVAPDLTHIGSRLTLAAGMFDNTLGTLGGWIASAQQMKPGNKMPSFNGLSGPDLRALAAYLDSLE